MSNYKTPDNKDITPTLRFLVVSPPNSKGVRILYSEYEDEDDAHIEKQELEHKLYVSVMDNKPQMEIRE